MISEDEARRLLQAAGDTIDVPPAPHPQPARSRRTPWLAAAAVVAVVAGGVVVASQFDGPDGADRPAERPSATSTVTDDVPPDGSMPSLFAMAVDDAVAQLEQDGIEAKVVHEYDCLLPVGRVLETTPGPGQALPPGSPATLVVSEGSPPTASCKYTGQDLWDLVDLGSGIAVSDRPGAPNVTFANEVSVVVDGGAPVTLTRAQALDPNTWTDGTALAVIADAVRHLAPPTDDGGAWTTPEVSARAGLPPLEECGVIRPGSEGDLDVRTLQIHLPGQSCPAAVDVFRLPSRTRDGEIVALFARTAKSGEVPSATVPDVRGMSRDKASETLIEAGFAVDVFVWERCNPGTGVTEQSRQRDGTAPLGSSVHITVEIDHPTGHCTGLAEAAGALIAWSRGGSAPEFADEVELLYGHAPISTLTGSDRANPNSWQACVSPAVSNCTNPLTIVASYDGDLERRWYEDNYPTYDDGTPLVDCTADLGGYPRTLEPEGRLSLHPPKSVPCADQWEIGVWVDAQGRLAAVDYSPPRR